MTLRNAPSPDPCILALRNTPRPNPAYIMLRSISLPPHDDISKDKRGYVASRNVKSKAGHRFESYLVQKLVFKNDT
jgi:hypothetical protein